MIFKDMTKHTQTGVHDDCNYDITSYQRASTFVPKVGKDAPMSTGFKE